MGFEKTNREVNERIQALAFLLEENAITERQKNELFSLIYPKLRYHVWKYVQNNDDTEDALQWTLKKIFNNISKYKRDSGRFTTWIYTVARNETLFFLYKKKLTKDVMAGGGLDSKYDTYAVEEDKHFDSFEEDYKEIYDKLISEIYNIEDSLLRNIAIDQMIKRDRVKAIATRYDINDNTIKTKLRKIRSDLKRTVLEKNPKFKDTLNHVFDI